MSQFQQVVITSSSKNFNTNTNSSLMLFSFGGKTSIAAVNPSQVSTIFKDYKGQMNPQMGMQKSKQAFFSHVQNSSDNQNYTPALDKLQFPNQSNKTQQNGRLKTFNGYKNVQLSNITSSQSVVHPQSNQLESTNFVQSTYQISQNIQKNLGKIPQQISQSDIGKISALNRAGASKLKEINEHKPSQQHLSRNNLGNYATLNQNGASKFIKENGAYSKITKSNEDSPVMFSGYYSNDYFDKVFGEDEYFKNKQEGTGQASSPFLSQLQRSICNAFQTKQSKLAAYFAGFWFCSNQPAMAFAGGVPPFSPNYSWIQGSIEMMNSPFFQEYSGLLTYAILLPTTYWFIILPSIQKMSEVSVMTMMVGWPYSGVKGAKKQANQGQKEPLFDEVTDYLLPNQ